MMKNAYSIDTDSSSGTTPPPASPYSRRRPRRKRSKKVTSHSSPVQQSQIPDYDKIVALPAYEEFELKHSINNNNIKADQQPQSTDCPEESFVFNFDSPTGSPYSRRYPASARKMRYVHI